MTPFSKLFKRHKQKFVQKFKNFKNHCENYPRKQNKTLRCVLIITKPFKIYKNILLYNLCIAYSVLDYLQVVPGAIPPEVRSSKLLMLECFLLCLYFLLEAIVLCLLFVICCLVCYLLFFLFQNIRIKKLRDDKGWVSQTQMPSRSKTAQELF
jgi:hypothetical protein